MGYGNPMKLLHTGTRLVPGIWVRTTKLHNESEEKGEEMLVKGSRIL